MVGLTRFPGRADTAASDDDIRAGDHNTVGEHIIRWLSRAEGHAQTGKNRDEKDNLAEQI
jgi:hypothetical protein